MCRGGGRPSGTADSEPLPSVTVFPYRGRPGLRTHRRAMRRAGRSVSGNLRQGSGIGPRAARLLVPFRAPGTGSTALATAVHGGPMEVGTLTGRRYRVAIDRKQVQRMDLGPGPLGSRVRCMVPLTGSVDEHWRACFRAVQVEDTGFFPLPAGADERRDHVHADGDGKRKRNRLGAQDPRLPDRGGERPRLEPRARIAERQVRPAVQAFFFWNSFMKARRASTPAGGNAL